jgi:hypothetical protein
LGIPWLEQSVNTRVLAVGQEVPCVLSLKKTANG